MANGVGSFLGRKLSDYECLKCNRKLNDASYTVGHIDDQIAHLFHQHCFKESLVNGGSRYCLICKTTEIKDNPLHVEKAQIDSSNEQPECSSCAEEIKQSDEVVGHVAEKLEEGRTVRTVEHLMHERCFNAFYAIEANKEKAQVCFVCERPVIKNPSIAESSSEGESCAFSFGDRKKNWMASLEGADPKNIPNYPMNNSDASEFLLFAVASEATAWIREVLNLDLSQTFKGTALFNEQRIQSLEEAAENGYLQIVQEFVRHDNDLRELGEISEGRPFTDEQLQRVYAKATVGSEVRRCLREESYLKELMKGESSAGPALKFKEEQLVLTPEQIEANKAVWEQVQRNIENVSAIQKHPLYGSDAVGFLNKATAYGRLPVVREILDRDLMNVHKRMTMSNVERFEAFRTTPGRYDVSLLREFLRHDNELRKFGERSEGRTFTDAHFRSAFEILLVQMDRGVFVREPLQCLLRESSANNTTKLEFMQRFFQRWIHFQEETFIPTVREILQDDLSHERRGPALESGDRVVLFSCAAELGYLGIVQEFIRHDNALRMGDVEDRARCFTGVQFRTVLERALPLRHVFRYLLEQNRIDWPTRLHLMQRALDGRHDQSFNELRNYPFAPEEYCQALNVILGSPGLSFAEKEVRLRDILSVPNLSLEARSRALVLLAARNDRFSRMEFLSYLCGVYPQIGEAAVIEAIGHLLRRRDTLEAVQYLYRRVSAERRDSLVVDAAIHHHPLFEEEMKPNCAIQ